MAINTLATATLFMTQLDKIAVQEATTGWMDANAGQVIYNGGSEVKIPKMSVQGMGDYDREAGYQRGSVTLEYETRKMTQDRGRLFQLDPMDINEANFIPTAGAVMGEFQRTQGSYKIQTDEKGRLHYILEDGTDIEERDGICLYVAADQLPDYRIISIKPYRFLTMEVEKI